MRWLKGIFLTKENTWLHDSSSSKDSKIPDIAKTFSRFHKLLCEHILKAETLKKCRCHKARNKSTKVKRVKMQSKDQDYCKFVMIAEKQNYRVLLFQDTMIIKLFKMHSHANRHGLLCFTSSFPHFSQGWKVKNIVAKMTSLF